MDLGSFGQRREIEKKEKKRKKMLKKGVSRSPKWPSALGLEKPVLLV